MRGFGPINSTHALGLCRLVSQRVARNMFKKSLVVWVFLAGTLQAAESQLAGRPVAWHPLTLSFEGPRAAATDNQPNPFLDVRLQVAFEGPEGRHYDVPGYFDGDGQGGPQGNVWRVRFTPDAAGTWRYRASFRTGPQVAVQLEPDAGQPLPLDGLAGEVHIAPRDPQAPGFLKWGRLNYVGGHYLKFVDGPYWIRGGTDEPEDLLGYAGFDHTPARHTYSAHVDDWRPGDPDWGDGRGRGIIGALNYLASRQVNSIYFLTMNIGGDGKDVWPWIGPINPKGSPDNDNTHFDLAKLGQWEIVFAHAQRLGIFLHCVFNEAEEANKRELDNGELGPERKLYYREMIARFGHHLAMQWNLCEEYNLNFDFGPQRIAAFADYVRAVDPYDHPITVHSAGDPVKALAFTFGDPRYSMTSLQLNQRPIHEVTEAIWRATAAAGRPLPVSLDEFTLDRGQRASHIPVDDADGQRREKLWPTYLSGGNIEFILGDLLRTDSFKTPERDKLWRYVAYARTFMEQLPFWEMEPADELAQVGATVDVGIGRGKSVKLGPQVFAKRGEVYAVYLPRGNQSGTLDLSELRGPAEQRWYNPRSGEFVGPAVPVTGGPRWAVGSPPAEASEDWAVVIRRTSRATEPAVDTSGFRDGIHHWRHIADTSRVIQAEPNQPSYAPDQVREIAANIVLFQRANGGWPKDYDMLAVLSEDQKETLRATHDRQDSSFDNYNIHSQVDYLAKAYALLGEPAWREACLRGFDFILASQLPCGGFPQRYPGASGYSAQITFNDGVTIGALEVLASAARHEPAWSWLDEPRRQRAERAVTLGIDCILKCQIRVGDRLTGWCQQHDAQTLAPIPARTFELASLCPQETTAIARFLMREQRPDARVKAAIESAVGWLGQVRLAGVRVDKVPAPVEQFMRHKANFDVVVSADPTAPAVWARHYEIGTNRPVFAGRDAVKRYALADIERERRTGTPWYGNWPRALLDVDYPTWQQRQAMP